MFKHSLNCRSVVKITTLGTPLSTWYMPFLPNRGSLIYNCFKGKNVAHIQTWILANKVHRQVVALLVPALWYCAPQYISWGKFVNDRLGEVSWGMPTQLCQPHTIHSGHADIHHHQHAVERYVWLVHACTQHICTSWGCLSRTLCWIGAECITLCLELRTCRCDLPLVIL